MIQKIRNVPTDIKERLARKFGGCNYTHNDVGCYVDGVKGVYCFDDIVRLAESHGFEVKHVNDDHVHVETVFHSRFGGCEFAEEIENEASDYMNEHFPVEGCTWGRNENSDWGLWEVEEE